MAVAKMSSQRDEIVWDTSLETRKRCRKWWRAGLFGLVLERTAISQVIIGLGWMFRDVVEENGQKASSSLQGSALDHALRELWADDTALLYLFRKAKPLV